MNRIIGAESCSAICSAMRGVGRAGAAGDEADSRPPGEPPLGQRHDRRARLLPADGELDRRIVHGVEGGEVGFAGNAIDPLDPLGDELVDENLSARSQSLAQRRSSLPVAFAGNVWQFTPFISIAGTKGRRLAHEASSSHSWAMSAPTERPAETSALTTLNARSREIFRNIVDSYLSSGEPVGSRHLSRMLPMSLSPASVRNVMQDLEELGLIYAPHASAGRMPTQQGLRLFVDALLEFGDLGTRGAGAHRRPSAGRGGGRRVRRRARRNDGPSVGIDPRRRRGADQQRLTRG